MWSSILEIFNPYEALQNRSKFVDAVVKDDSYGIFPPPTEAQTGLDTIQEYLMPGFQVADPISSKQINTVFVHELLMKYSRKYRKHYKRAIRETTK